MPLQVHFFKRLTGSWGGGQGANGQLIEWSNNTGTHLVGPRAFHSGAPAISELSLESLCGEGVVADVSEAVSDYSFYTPEMIEERVTVGEGDILVVHTGYRRYAWDQPDVDNPAAQGGVENKEFGYYVRHPGPSPEFFRWALDKKLKAIGVDCGCAEHPMNTNVRRLHGAEFEKAEARAREEYGKGWDELFPPDEYYALTHREMPRSGLLLVAVMMTAGGLLQSRRVAETMSRRIADLNPGQGLTANLATAGLVLGASRLGLPVSTTHVSCGTIFGIGLVNRSARGRTIAQILLTWVTTLPVGFLLGAGIYLLLTA